MSERTAGQAAYEGMADCALHDGGPRGISVGWDNLEPWQRLRWEAAASSVAGHLAETANAARAAEIATRPAEGWSRIIPPERKSHYFVKGRSLCGRRGFPPEPLSEDDYTSPDDCAGCRKKLTLRQARAAEARQ